MWLYKSQFWLYNATMKKSEKISQLGLFRNYEFISHSSDFFSCNSDVFSRICGFINHNSDYITQLCRKMSSQFWLSLNCELISCNSDFFCCNCTFISRSYHFFPSNSDDFSRNYEFISRSSGCFFFRNSDSRICGLKCQNWEFLSRDCGFRNRNFESI